MRRNTDFKARPNSKEAEATLIADIISAPESIIEAQRFVSQNMFTGPDAVAWKTLCEMWESGKQISISTAYGTIDNEYLNEKIRHLYSSRTGSGYEVAGDAMTLATIHARQIVYDGALELLRIVESTAEPHELISRIERLRDQLSGNAIESKAITNADAINLLAEEIESIIDRTTQCVPTSLPTLDILLNGGFAPGSLVILAARPSVGKSALMMQFAMTAARAGTPTMVYSMEMTATDLARRELFSTGAISSADLSFEAIKAFDFSKFENVASSLSGLPLKINAFDTNIERICAEITTLHQQGQCDFACVDYLGLSERIDPKDTLANDLGARTRKLKNLAKRIGIPIVVLCQLNRESESFDEPQLKHLKDSGNIEADADVIVFLSKTQNQNEVNLWIKKNRNGRRDICIPLEVSNCYTTFKEYPTEYV